MFWYFFVYIFYNIINIWLLKKIYLLVNWYIFFIELKIFISWIYFYFDYEKNNYFFYKLKGVKLFVSIYNILYISLFG